MPDPSQERHAGVPSEISKPAESRAESFVTTVRQQFAETFRQDSKVLKFIKQLTDGDLTTIYAEWRSQPNWSFENQIGFVNEIIGLRYEEIHHPLNDKERQVRDIILFLLQGSNQNRFFGEQKTNPDGLSIRYGQRLVIDGVIECKMKKPKDPPELRQKRTVRQTIIYLIQILNDFENEELPQIIREAQQLIRQITESPITISDNLKLIYLLPKDANGIQNEKENIHSEYHGLTPEDIGKICKIVSGVLKAQQKEPI